VGVDDEFFGGSLVEVFIALGGFVESYGGDVDGFGDLDFFVEDALHELAVVAHHGALAGGEVVGFGPTETDADAEHADFGVGVDAAGVAGDVEAGDA